MAKRQTKFQKFKDYYDAFKCVEGDKKMKREGAKDGSISTHPVVNVNPDLSEKEVLRDCIILLNHYQIFHNRHDSGSFQNQHGQWGTYGIKGAGDIIGLLKTGQHFEIEAKRGKGGRLSLIQQKRMKQIQENNGLYYVIHGLNELKFYFRGLI